MFSELLYLLIVVFKVKDQDPHVFRKKKFQFQIIYLNLSFLPFSCDAIGTYLALKLPSFGPFLSLCKRLNKLAWFGGVVIFDLPLPFFIFRKKKNNSWSLLFRLQCEVEVEQLNMDDQFHFPNDRSELPSFFSFDSLDKYSPLEHPFFGLFSFLMKKVK